MGFWEGLRRSVFAWLKPRNLMLYFLSSLVFSLVSFLLPYELQVHVSILGGVTVALLLLVSTVLSQGFSLRDMVFVAGILSLLVALFSSDLPTRAVLLSVRHLSLITSVFLTGLDFVLRTIRTGHLSRLLLAGPSSTKRTPPKKGLSGLPDRIQLGSMRTFFSVCCMTLSSELCSCLHPALFLELLGIAALVENQVKLGFVVMMTTLVEQIRHAYRIHRSIAMGRRLRRGM